MHKVTNRYVFGIKLNFSALDFCHVCHIITLTLKIEKFHITWCDELKSQNILLTFNDDRIYSTLTVKDSLKKEISSIMI